MGSATQVPRRARPAKGNWGLMLTLVQGPHGGVVIYGQQGVIENSEKVRKGTKMGKLRKYNLYCALCQVSNDPIDVPFEVSGMTQGEIWDHITEPANARGWDVRRDSENQQRFFVCPGCQIKERNAKHDDDNPSEFCKDGKCPKCGHDEIETLYCGGARFAQDIYREPKKDWLQRKCKRCKYTWKESPLDRELLTKENPLGKISMALADASLCTCAGMIIPSHKDDIGTCRRCGGIRSTQKGIEDVQLLNRSVDQPQSTGDNPLV